MKLFKPFSILMLATLVFFTSCSDDDDTEPQYQGDLPAVAKTSIAVDEELEISYSSTSEDGFSYEITEGNEYVSVIEKDGMHYIKGLEPGEATLILSNKAGESTVTISVVTLPVVEKTSIAVDEEIEISYSSTTADDFSYEITEGSEFISILEKDGAHYIKGVEPGNATIILTNNAGSNTVTISVVGMAEVEKTTINVGDEIEIMNSNTSGSGFSYEITSGGDFVSVIEKDGMHYIAGVDRGEATLVLSNVAGDLTVTIKVESVPIIEEEAIGINEEVAIKYSSTTEDGFSYSISEGAEFISIEEHDGMHYITGVDVGEFTMTLTNADGDSTITKNVVVKVEQVGDYYQDYQGINYNIYADTKTAALAGNSANFDVDFTPLDGKITIPADVYFEGEEYPVTSVERISFYNVDEIGNNTIKSLYFAEGSNIEEIAFGAFSTSSNLVSVDLSNCASLDSIGSFAFYKCGNLETLNFSGCTSLNSINSYCFSYNYALTTVDLRECTSLKIVELQAFHNFNDNDNKILVTLPGEVSDWRWGNGNLLTDITINYSNSIGYFTKIK